MEHVSLVPDLHCSPARVVNLFPKQQILDSSKLKEVADNNFEYDKNAGKFTKKGRKHWEKEKLLVTSNFSFSHSVFKRLALQIRKNKDLFWKGLSGERVGLMTWWL